MSAAASEYPTTAGASTFLGIDCGGSGSRWAVVDAAALARAADGAAHSGATDTAAPVVNVARWRGEGPPVQASATDAAGAAGALLPIVLHALERAGEAMPAAAAIGVAGAGDAAVRRAIAAALGALLPATIRDTMPVHVVADTHVAAAAALDAPGLAVRAGTGSFVLARDAAGALHRAGGRGSLLGDEGSAYDLVRHAAMAVVAAHDGLGAPTALTAALVAAFGVGAAGPARLGAEMQRLPPGAIAERLPRVAAAATAGDEVAGEVLRAGGARLGAVAAALARRAGLLPQSNDRATPPLLVTYGGGVLAHLAPVREALAGQLREHGIEVELRPARRDPAVGAALLARALHRGERPLCDWVRAD